MNRGIKYYEPTGETTEWEDILVKKGILAPRRKLEDDDEDDDTYEEGEGNGRHPLEHATLNELDEQEDDYDDDAELRRIREKRMDEMRANALRAKFGSVEPITKQDWTKEVTEASSASWVVAYLFDHNVEACKLMDQVLPILASRHKDVKFVSIQSQACIENWPERNLPTLFMYHNGNLEKQILTLNKLGGLDMKVEDLEEHLVSLGVLGKEE